MIIELGAQKISVSLATMVLFLLVHLYVKFDFFSKNQIYNLGMRIYLDAKKLESYRHKNVPGDGNELIAFWRHCWTS